VGVDPEAHTLVLTLIGHAGKTSCGPCHVPKLGYKCW
jgi:hypothetical protein